MIKKEDVIRAAIKMFEQKGIKFSMLSVAQELATSKRSIYVHFESKQELTQSIVNYLFDEIDVIHRQILGENISQIEKLKRILLVYPKSINMDKVELHSLLKNNPQIFEMIDKRLAANWELTLTQFQRCVDEGSIKPIDRWLFRDLILMIYEKSLTYENHQQILKEWIDIVFNGIETR